METTINISELKNLDKVTFAEIEKNIEEYKTIRLEIIRRLDGGKSFDELLNDAKLSLEYWQCSFEDCHDIESWRAWGETKKYLSILRQLDPSREEKNLKIKFRARAIEDDAGKAITEEKFVCGNIWASEDNSYVIIGELKNGLCRNYKVDPESIAQFVGCNSVGEEIFVPLAKIEEKFSQGGDLR